VGNEKQQQTTRDKQQKKATQKAAEVVTMYDWDWIRLMNK
jgi:hypothetical protein